MSSILTFSNRSVELFTLKNRFLITAKALHSIRMCLTVQVVWQVKHCGCGSCFKMKEWVSLVWPIRNQDITNWLMISHWSLSDRRSSQVSCTLLSILADLNNTAVWIVSTRPPISNSSSLLFNLWRIVPSAPIIGGITVTFLSVSF